jgi:AraC family transcriptional regulator
MQRFESISTTRLALTPASQDSSRPAPSPRERVARERRDEGNPGASENGGWNGLLPWQVKRVRDYVDAELHGSPSLRMAAGQVRLSPSYFSRCFRRSFGVTFSRFVAARRVERAQGLMTRGVDKLCQIALACGFSDQAHFTRTFGNLLGCTPSWWRRQAVGNRLAAPVGETRPGRQTLLGHLEFHSARSWELSGRVTPSGLGGLQEYRP